MIPARLKRAARAAVQACGGAEGAAATCGRTKSTAGRWMALHEPDLPTVDCAVAMDQVAVADGKAPPLVTAMAAEVGGVFLALPHAAGAGSLTQPLAAMMREFGELSASIVDAEADGNRDPGELDRIAAELDDLIRLAVEMRAVVVAERERV